MRRILIVKTSSMGDVVHNLPIVADIREAMNDVTIDWVVEENFVDIVRMNPGVDTVIPVAWRRWRKSLSSRETWGEMLDFRYRIKKVVYDIVLDTQGLIKSAAIAKMARSRSRLGYSAEVARESLAARFYTDTFVIPKNAHAVERNRWLAGAALGYYPDEHRLDYGLVTEPLVRDGEKPYALFVHATSRPDKCWPIADWIALGRRFNAKGLSVVLPWGSEQERLAALEIADGLADVIVLPKLKLDQLASWISQATLVVGVDTGLIHLSAALERPTVGVYLTTSPDLTGVYAGKRGVNVGNAGRPPSVEGVDDEVERLLRRLARQ